jgi:hypothetical protein
MLRGAMMWDNTINNTPRLRHDYEVYSLECFSCGREIEVAVIGPHCCPLCSTPLRVEWRPR